MSRAGFVAGKEAIMSLKDRAQAMFTVANRWIRIWIRDFIDTVTRTKPASISYRYLARHIAVRFEDNERTKCIVFSSADWLTVSNDVLLMVAYFLHTELNTRVLLVDGSFRDDGVSDRFGFTQEAGLSECLYESGHTLSHYIKPTANPGVFVLPAGKLSDQAKHPVEAQSFLSRLEKLNQFDYVLIQQGPIVLDTRYLTFAQSADLVLLYVREGSTLVSELKECQKIFRDYKIQNVGLIISEADG